MAFTSDVSYSKVYLADTVTVDTSKTLAKMIYANGQQASYGVVTIANSNGGVISRAQNDVSLLLPAESNNQVVFQVSGSFGGSFSALSISVTAGASWTQSVFDRQYGSGGYSYYAATYI